MGRIRTVKPELFVHEDLFDLEEETGFPMRTAFMGLFTCCDREGRFKWRPRTLKVHVLPHDNIDFSRVLDALVTRGFVWKYRVNNEIFGVIPSWSDHQSINNKERPSSIPEPFETIEECNASLTREPREGNACRKERKGKEGKGREQVKDSAPEDFIRFWKAFADPRGKAPALKVWKKLNPNPELADKIVSGAKAYAEWRQTGKPSDQTGKMAQGWLSDQRWEDVIEIPKRKKSLTTEERIAAL